MSSKLRGRAVSSVDKSEVMARILRAWQAVPDLRLGQFLMNLNKSTSDMFYTEDEALARACESYAVRHGK